MLVEQWHAPLVRKCGKNDGRKNDKTYIQTKILPECKNGGRPRDKIHDKISCA